MWRFIHEFKLSPYTVFSASIQQRIITNRFDKRGMHMGEKRGHTKIQMIVIFALFGMHSIYKYRNKDWNVSS